jgi:hypothetical protein
MNTTKYQRGFINIPTQSFEWLFRFAYVGIAALIILVVALFVLSGWGIWWLIQHVRFV